MTAQNKEEFEKRIDAKAVPENAVEAIQPFLKEAKRIRWYHEYDGDKESFECKFKKFGYWFSVEFDKEGLLEDVEIKIKYHTLPHDIKEKIIDCYLLSEDCLKHEISSHGRNACSCCRCLVTLGWYLIGLCWSNELWLLVSLSKWNRLPIHI